MTARSAILVQCANGTLHTAELGFFPLQSRAHRLYEVIGTQHKLECLRTTGPLFRTYEHSDYRTFITESCKSRHRTYEPSDCRTFGMKNPLFRTYEPSDYRTFGLESSHPDFQLIFKRLLSKSACLRGSAPDPAGALRRPHTPSWKRLVLTTLLKNHSHATVPTCCCFPT